MARQTQFYNTDYWKGYKFFVAFFNVLYVALLNFETEHEIIVFVILL